VLLGYTLTGIAVWGMVRMGCIRKSDRKYDETETKKTDVAFQF